MINIMELKSRYVAYKIQPQSSATTHLKPALFVLLVYFMREHPEMHRISAIRFSRKQQISGYLGTPDPDVHEFHVWYTTDKAMASTLLSDAQEAADDFYKGGIRTIQPSLPFSLHYPLSLKQLGAS